MLLLVAHSMVKHEYEIAYDLADYFDINVTSYEYDASGSVEEITVEAIEEEEPDYEEDYEV